MNRALVTVALITFGTTMFARTTDPIIPKIADTFHIAPATAALLTTAFALPYALVQPVLGALGDSFGKARLMVLCAATGVLATLACAIAPTFPVLISTRIIGGSVSGGVFPVAVAMIGDLFPIAQRQVAIGRVVATGMLGNLAGASLGGIVGDLWGWRGAFVVTGLIAAATLVGAPRLLREVKPEHSEPLTLSSALANYRKIFANPLARVCFSSVFFDALVIFGLFPYMATLLQKQGETHATIAGIIIASFGFGAVIYSVIVRRLLALFGDRWLMIVGGFIMAAGLMTIPLQPTWPLEAVIFLIMGVAFFLLHGGIQVYATELAPTARSSAMAIHSSSFFFGQAIGPIGYGLSFDHLGETWTFAIAAVVIAAVGIYAAAMLRHPETGRAG